MTQLNVAADMDPSTLLMAQVCRPALNCEALRSQIFAGKRQPIVLGEPQEWMGWLFQAATHAAQGKLADAESLREKALEASPTISGLINDQKFEWLADADTRIGPMLEAIVDGKYYWIPFTRIKEVLIEEPKDLRDVVWSPANIMWTTGGHSVALIPTRYPGSELSPDAAIRFARKTDWEDKGHGSFFGLGQRLFTTDQGDFPILQVRRIALDNEVTGSAPPPGQTESATNVSKLHG
jgi:type VI secretion system protein ImpE